MPDPTKPEAPLSFDDRDPLILRAAVTAAVTAVVHVVVVLGAPLDSSAETAIGAAVDGLGLVVLLILARRKVTPNAKVVARVTSRGRVVAGEAAVEPTETVLAVDPPYTDDVGRPEVTVRSELLADPHAHDLGEGPGI